jgi:hypothetical protein
MPVGGARVDVVFGEWRGSRSLRPGAPLSLKECTTLAGLLSDDYAKSTGSVVSALVRRGLVRVENDVPKVEAKIPHLRVRIVAVEAKLGRVEEVLRQAVSTQSFADASYVLLPEPLSRLTTDALLAFSSLGVGLLTFDGRRVTKRLQPAGSSMSQMHLRLWVADRLLRSAEL